MTRKTVMLIVGIVGFDAVVAMTVSNPGLLVAAAAGSAAAMVVLLMRRTKTPSTHANPNYKPPTYYINCLIFGDMRKQMTKYERRTLKAWAAAVIIPVIIVIGLFLPKSKALPTSCESHWNAERNTPANSYKTHAQFIQECEASAKLADDVQKLANDHK